MEDFLQNMSGKKIALITISLLFVMCVVAVISYVNVASTIRHSKPNNPGKLLNTQQDQSPIFATPTPALSQKDLSKTYLTNDFLVSYPTNWVGHMTYQTDGQTATFQPSHLPDVGYSTSFSITEDSDQVPLPTRLLPYTAKGFAQSVAYIGGSEWTKVSGTDSGTPPMQESDFFLTREGKTITIQYKYTGSVPDAPTENFFKQFLDSVSLF